MFFSPFQQRIYFSNKKLGFYGFCDVIISTRLQCRYLSIIFTSCRKKNYNNCLKLAENVHKILGCKSIARTDFILNSKNNKIYFLETNTQPGLTSVSLLPEQAKFKGITFQDIILGVLKNFN